MKRKAYKIGAFGKRVKEYREGAGLTQETIADRSGLRVGQLSDIERGVVEDPRLSTVVKILNAMNAGLDDLIVKTKGY